MNISHSTSRYERNVDFNDHPRTRKMKQTFTTGLLALFCFTLSPAWAGDYSRNGSTPTSIQLTGFSIYINPGGLHLGIGGHSYGRNYGRSHLHPFAKRNWKHQKRHYYRHGYGSSKRFGHRHGWEKERHRGKFRGQHSHRRHRH